MNSEVTIESLKPLVNEFLLTIDDFKDYWDGIYSSDREMASRFLGEFMQWLEKRNRDTAGIE